MDGGHPVIIASWRYAALAPLLLAGVACASAAPLTARIEQNGSMTVRDGRTVLASVSAGLFEDEWQGRSLSGAPSDGTELAPGERTALLSLPDDRGTVDLRVTFEVAGGRLVARYVLKPSIELRVNSIHVSLDLPLRPWVGGTWATGDRQGGFTQERGPTGIYSGKPEALELTTAGGQTFAVACPSGQNVMLQDSRQWGGGFEVRVGDGSVPARTWAAGEEAIIEVALDMGGDAKVEYDAPTVTAASDEWLPLEGAQDVAPGSALDWSDQGLCDAPAGKHGWLVARNGHFEFDGRPGVPVRFYGVNFCFSALTISHEIADQVARRLRMLGYNALRIHHYDGALVEAGGLGRVTLKPEAMDQLEYLIAALKREGIYVTTDIYVSRPVPAGGIWPDAGGNVGMDEFKTLVAVSDIAFENWCGFARELLSHVSPYTGLALKDDPALTTLVMVNEDNYLNFIGNLPPLTRALWQAAWGEWLTERYGDRAGLAAAWGDSLKPDEDPAQGTVLLAGGGAARDVDRALFCADRHRRTFAKMSQFLREELGVRALLTDMNAWTENIAHQVVRTDFDWVDTHFYWDHPNFLERPWSLPSRGWSGGECAVSARGAGARDQALLRLLDKPFTISEFNFVAPNEYRSEGGLLMGAIAGLQDWGGLYRFAYSHDQRNLAESRPVGFFDVASDPLSLASDRVGVLLFLRGDVKAAAHSVALPIDADITLDSPPSLPDVHGQISELAYVTRIGTQVGPGNADVVLAGLPGVAGTTLDVQPTAADASARVVAELRKRGWLDAANPTDIDKGLLASETGEVVLDADAGTLAVATPRTAAVFARDPGAELVAGGLRVTLQGTGGSVVASALDGKPLADSRRVLIMHLTDVRNSGMRFRDKDQKVLEAWGEMPYLVRAGSAAIRLGGARGDGLRVWALRSDGSRAGEVELRQAADGVSFVADTRGPEGGRLFYELAAE